MKSLATRLMSKVDKNGPNGCWLWLGTKDGRGYGQIRSKGRERLVKAHRVSYELFVGPIPDGLTIDHLCRTKHCVNPSHLEPVSMRENLMRSDSQSSQNARKTHCRNGHEFVGESLILVKTPFGIGRRCRLCDQARDRRRRGRRSVQAEMSV